MLKTYGDSFYLICFEDNYSCNSDVDWVCETSAEGSCNLLKITQNVNEDNSKRLATIHQLVFILVKLLGFWQPQTYFFLIHFKTQLH